MKMPAVTNRGGHSRNQISRLLIRCGLRRARRRSRLGRCRGRRRGSRRGRRLGSCRGRICGRRGRRRCRRCRRRGLDVRRLGRLRSHSPRIVNGCPDRDNEHDGGDDKCGCAVHGVVSKMNDANSRPEMTSSFAEVRIDRAGAAVPAYPRPPLMRLSDKLLLIMTI